MESSLGHKDTDETYYNSFGIFSTSCIKNRKAFKWSLSFVLHARLFIPAVTGFHQLFDLRFDETDSGVI